MADIPEREKSPAGWPPSRRRIDELFEDATVDAYGDAEQRAGFFAKLEDHLQLPFETMILGATARVKKIDLTVSDQIVAICFRGAHRQSIPILDLTLPDPPPAGAEWIEAYRHWARVR